MAKRFELSAVFKGIDRVSRPITRMSGKVQRSMRTMGAGISRVNRKLQKFSKSARSAFGVAGIAGLAAGAALAIRSVVTTGAEFEETLINAAARFNLIKKGTAAFDDLERAARKVGSTTEFTATQAAKGLDFFARAGNSAVDSIALLPIAVDLATASGSDLASVTDIATDTLSAFELKGKTAAVTAKNFALLANQMAKSVNSSNMDMEQLSETMKKIAPTANAAGQSFAQVAGLMTQLADRGVKASDAGTVLKNIFLKLADKGVQTKLQGIGVNVLDPMTKQFREMPEIFGDFEKALVGVSKPNIIAGLNELFGLRGIVGGAVLLESADAAGKMVENLTDDKITGFLKSINVLIRDSTAIKMRLLGSAFQDLNISLFKVNQEGLDEFIINLTESVKGVTEFVDANPELIKTLRSFVLLGGALLIVGVAVAGIAAMVGFVAGSSAALVGVGVGAAAAYLSWLDVLDDIRAWFDDFFAADFIGKVQRVALKQIEIMNPFTGGIGGFLARRQIQAGNFTDEPEQGPSGVLGPTGRQQQSFIERLTQNNGTLVVRAEPGTSVESDQQRVGPFRLDLQQSGAN